MKVLILLVAFLAAHQATAQTAANFSNPLPGAFTNVNDSSLTASAPVYTDASKNLTSAAPAGYSAVLSGTSASLGGGALLAGACSNGTTTVTGATTSMAVSVSAAGGTDPGDDFYVRAYVSAANTVTVKVCAAIAGTPTATTYNVRVFQ